MKVLYWNVYIGHNPDHVMEELRQMIKDYRPDVVGLGEASKMGRRTESIRGYDSYWLPETHVGAGGTIALVRNDVNLRKWYWKKFTTWWKGPKHGWRQGPKRFWVGRIKDKDLGLVRLSIGHWPFNLALPEVESWCVRWFKRVLPLRRSVHLGDLNMREEETERFVKQFNGREVGIGLDRAMFKNCVITARDLGKHGSDHPAVLFNITKKKGRVKRALEKLTRRKA